MSRFDDGQLPRRAWVLAVLAGHDRVMRPAEIAKVAEMNGNISVYAVACRRLEDLGLVEPVLPGGRTTRRPGHRVVAYGYRITDAGRVRLAGILAETRRYQVVAEMTPAMAELVGVEL